MIAFWGPPAVGQFWQIGDAIYFYQVCDYLILRREWELCIGLH